MSGRYYAAVYLILTQEDKILLSKRSNTGFYDEYYSLVSGHIENGETAKEAIIREAKEEIGISINANDLVFKTILHRRSVENLEVREYHDYIFYCNKYIDNIVNKEPEKCSELGFFSINSLPIKTIPYVRNLILSKLIYQETGFELSMAYKDSFLVKAHNLSQKK